VQQNKMMKFQFDANAQNALRQSGISNIFGGASDIAGGVMQYGSYQNAQEANANQSAYNEMLRKAFLQKQFGV